MIQCSKRRQLLKLFSCTYRPVAHGARQSLPLKRQAPGFMEGVPSGFHQLVLVAVVAAGALVRGWRRLAQTRRPRLNANATVPTAVSRSAAPSGPTPIAPVLASPPPSLALLLTALVGCQSD